VSGFLVPPTKNPGDVLTSALWNSYIRDNLNFGIVRPIADLLLGAPAAQMDFTSIPATFAHLLLVVYARGDTSATATNLSMRFNADGGANYQIEYILGTGSTVTAVEALAQSVLYCGGMPAATATANFFGATSILIPHYAQGTSHKSAEINGGYRTVATTGGGNTQKISGWWSNVSIINEVNVFPLVGNFIAGSRAILYGLGGI
jgi:hypothetical protein